MSFLYTFQIRSRGTTSESKPSIFDRYPRFGILTSKMWVEGNISLFDLRGTEAGLDIIYPTNDNFE